ncbi:hypothetical protein J3Q64DRAFT_1718430 [Phycomyces blakesleeanus]|uniref:Uncharacterized protein n=2 Tax=Phycomyces blakesleeanus TaxID=4837 RepID=A0A167PY87_PHYB8|nr:hypothetical protein PHYBLDRAFT_37402 [Phycomyces blakesleeanus NRRL 1555(-)]OAD78759.1 hypothetical protein PHYBLDRAFT_37402 [Phycomyces blakesleeanus NRRL 1555(-)]|eukprot:XP_018296799.1 hypothetical protein PHYBLDRAFT_37402 [Phycomyces blakesleeanus NRRL 1555(-)]
MSISDDAVLELIFNPDVQGLPLDSINQSITNTSVCTLSPGRLEELKHLEKDAIKLAEKNETGGALELLNRCIEMEPTYGSAYNNRAQLYRMVHKNDEALHDLNKVISLAEGQPKILKQAYTQRAIIKRQNGDILGSKEDFAIGAKYGNSVARNITIQDNPYAKMCNQVMLQVMSQELNIGSTENKNHP